MEFAEKFFFSWLVEFFGEMYKNQLQELAQRSCFNLPSYACIREGPDHAPRFKATVNFNGETFESPQYCSTLRQAEHSAAEMALNALAGRGPSNSLAARILDETGVYKNLLQEVSQRVGASLPAYTTFRSGLGHLPVFTCTVELAGVIFTGESAKNKKQAEKNAAMAAWTSLKFLVQQSETPTPEKGKNDEQEHITVARALQKYLVQARMAKIPFPIKFPTQNPRPPNAQQPQATSSKILPFICPRPARNRIGMAANGSSASKISPQNRPSVTTLNEIMINPKTTQSQPANVGNECVLPSAESAKVRLQKFPAVGAAPYIPIRHLRPHHRVAPPVTVRSAVPVYSSPPLPAPSQSARMVRPSQSSMAPPVSVRQAMPVLSAPTVGLEQLSLLDSTIQADEASFCKAPPVKFEEPLGSKVPLGQLALNSTIQADEAPLSNVPMVKLEEPLGSKVSFGQLDNLPSAEVNPGNAEDCRLTKAPNLLIQNSASSNIPRSPEVSPNQVELPVLKISKDPHAN